MINIFVILCFGGNSTIGCFVEHGSAECDSLPPILMTPVLSMNGIKPRSLRLRGVGLLPCIVSELRHWGSFYKNCDWIKWDGEIPREIASAGFSFILTYFHNHESVHSCIGPTRFDTNNASRRLSTPTWSWIGPMVNSVKLDANRLWNSMCEYMRRAKFQSEKYIILFAGMTLHTMFFR